MTVNFSPSQTRMQGPPGAARPGSNPGTIHPYHPLEKNPAILMPYSMSKTIFPNDFVGNPFLINPNLTTHGPPIKNFWGGNQM